MLDMAILLRPTDFLSGLLRVWCDPTPRRMNILLAAFTRDWLLAWICRALQPTTVRTQSTVALQGEPRTVLGARMRSCKPSNDELPGCQPLGIRTAEIVRICGNMWLFGRAGGGVLARLFVFSLSFSRLDWVVVAAGSLHCQPQVASGAPWSNSGRCEIETSQFETQCSK